MHTPLDILLDPATLFVLGLYALLFAWERIAPGRALPHVPGRTWLGLAAFLSFLMVSAYLPLLWGGALAPPQVADLSAWPNGAAAAVGVLLYEFVAYGYHHQRGVHRDNYGDLPLVDMLFGSFRNPRRHAAEVGFRPGASLRVADMLIARDVSQRR